MITIYIEFYAETFLQTLHRFFLIRMTMRNRYSTANCLCIKYFNCRDHCKFYLYGVSIYILVSTHLIFPNFFADHFPSVPEFLVHYGVWFVPLSLEMTLQFFDDNTLNT